MTRKVRFTKSVPELKGKTFTSKEMEEELGCSRATARRTIREGLRNGRLEEIRRKR